jgi:hypothetical protein
MKFDIIHDQNRILARKRVHFEGESFEKLDENFSIDCAFYNRDIKDTVEGKGGKDRVP